MFAVVKTHRSWAGRATVVDELVDGVRVVGEVGGQGLVGQGIAVRGDEVLEVGGDLLSIGIAHAVGGGTGLDEALWEGSDGGDKGRSGGEDERTHL